MADHPSFELIEQREIADLNTTAMLYRHKKTGAQVLSLVNDDENKSFGITFRTPPNDSTGVPHIMEHSVLCGSRKYPVKEPFVELIKGSLNTFLNAMTYPDKTCYPVASQNLQDFYNLVDVYLDAVFYPRIWPEILQQEGWHYELDSLDAPLVYKGVVFNEMKGAYSSPDGVLSDHIQQALFPDTPYGYDSGGDPKVIPDLTYEQFKQFHDTYYHPSNAFIYFYGDDDPAKRLDIIEAYLKDYEAAEVDSEVPMQPRFDAPQSFTHTYAAGEDDAAQEKTYVTVSWLVDDTLNMELNLAMSVLSYILVGKPAAPLYKELVDSGLGEDLTGSYNATHLRQMFFTTGLKGVPPENIDKVEPLILETLSRFSKEGFAPEIIEAAFNRIEFSLRENNTGSFPRGLSLMLRALTPWLHGETPLDKLSLQEPMAALRQKAENSDGFFEQLIREYLLDNPHRVTVIMKPDAEQQQREEAAEAEKLAAIRAQMSEDDLKEIMEQTAKLKAMQEAPDSPEALATIPSLSLEDIEKENIKIPLEVLEEGKGTILYHDLFTNGIVYFDVGLNMRAIPQRLLPYLDLFRRAMLQIGTLDEDFVQLSRRIDRATGGVWASDFISAKRGSDQSAMWLFLRGKAVVDRFEEMLGIMKDILLKLNLNNQERFLQLVLENKARSEASLVPGGHVAAYGRLKATDSEAGWADEQISGIDNLFFVRELAARVQNDWPSVLTDLEEIRETLVNGNAMVYNVTVDEANWQEIQPALNDFRASMPTAPVTLPDWEWEPQTHNEALTIPAQVNYVGKGVNLYEHGYNLDGSLSVITNYLKTTWLWERVRVQGGAYGGFCTFDPQAGTFAYLSYRDPNLLGTVENYDNASQFLERLDLSKEELTKSIIGAISNMDGYQFPDAKGFSSLRRYLIDYTEEERQQYREQILSTTADDFHAFGETLAEAMAQGRVVVVGSQEAVEKANAEKGEAWLQMTKVL